MNYSNLTNEQLRDRVALLERLQKSAPYSAATVDLTNAQLAERVELLERLKVLESGGESAPVWYPDNRNWQPYTPGCGISRAHVADVLFNYEQQIRTFRPGAEDCDYTRRGWNSSFDWHGPEKIVAVVLRT